MSSIFDRVMEAATTTGTGDFTLAGAYTGYRAFSAVCTVGMTIPYVIVRLDVNGNETGEWEVGTGIYSASNTLTRTSVEASSNAGAAVNFSAGNKRVMLDASTKFLTAPQIQSVASAATVTPTFNDDQVNITAQAAALNLANPTGTTVDGWGIAIRIKDNGTARAITYNGGSGSQYRAIGVTLPTTTVISKTLYLGMVYNAADTKWDVVAVAQEV